MPWNMFVTAKEVRVVSKKKLCNKKIAWKRVTHEKTKNRGEFASFAPRIAQKKS